MSRHKLVKALDLDEELDDFDGGAESDSDEGVSIEDKEQLRLGLIKVRDVLGPDVPVTNEEIEDSLWHYYYDVEKTVNYIITSCGSDFSAAEFFKDSPWLNVPKDRLGEILIEPLYPPSGLLGGASKQDSAPKSKLAALAAARKNKENQRPEDVQTTKSVALLDKLGAKSRRPLQKTIYPSSDSRNSQSEQTSEAQPRRYHSQRAKDIVPSQGEKLPQWSPVAQDSQPASKVMPKADRNPIASPSAFAQTISGPSKRHQELAFTLPQYNVHVCEGHTEFNFAGPSPDDIVTKAQNSKGLGTRSAKQQTEVAGDDQRVNGVAQAVKNVSIEDAKVGGKNLDVLAEFEKSKAKKAANFVVIGHVDAGKSTLMGRLLHDLNVVDKRTIDKYRKEAERMGKSSFALAWVLDQGTEERERGVTIDIAMNKFETENTSFTILDAPGHRDFIPNMIAGASQADFAVLVIDASVGNFESGLKGQTKEHALLVRSMGVQRIVIAINKLDTVDWSQDRFDEISQQVSAFLTGAGFQAKNLAFVPCAGLTGENIVRKTNDPQASWYTGPPLISLLESSEPVARALGKPFRLTVDDIFRGGVQNPLSISGRLDAGSVQVGDAVLVVPANQTAAIKGLEVDSEPTDWAVAGHNIILHLTNIEAKYLRPGDVICSPSTPVPCITSFNARVLAFEHITPMHCEVHKGRLHAPAKITKLITQLDSKTGVVIKGKKPRLIKPGSVARVCVEVDDPIPLEQGARVILRSGGETVGAGLVE
ncbi:elongation factor 1 alpha-like protein, partial [Lecanoromycetidae sp. Uapishka_2]